MKGNGGEKKADHSSSEGGDVPGGIQNAGGWGDGRMEKSGLKGVCLFLMVKCLEVRNMLYHMQTVYLLIRKFVV